MATFVRDIGGAQDALRRADYAGAARLLKRVLAAAPTHSRANELMALVEAARGDQDAVFRRLSIATRARGASETAWYALGAWFHGHGRNGEAIGAFRSALGTNAHFFPALHDLGLALHDDGEAAAALEAFDRAIAVAPDSFEPLHNRGRALHALGRFEDAIASYDQAIAMNPLHGSTWVNRGESCSDLQRYDEALDNYAHAVKLNPGDADAQWNESLTRLVLGQFEAGLPKYEYRWKGPRAWRGRHSEIPAWSADQPVAGKRILVWWEQGLGDTLHFCRYAPLLARRGVEVVLEVQPALKDLVASVGECTVLADGESLPACDVQISLLSLPLLFATTVETIPATVPYLAADPEHVRAWKERLGPGDGRERIGIACSGHPHQKDDRYRSMPLREFAPLLSDANLFLIQTHLKEDDRQFLAVTRGIDYLGDQIRDFSDSAAIVANLERVVTIDTSLAHLAGALGKPLSIMLPWTPTWRWMASRSDSPWYPTARLFRQKSRGDWAGVIAEVRATTRPLP